MSNKFEYSIQGNAKIKGYFNIFQSIYGSIIMELGGKCTRLTNNQINDLGIDVYQLIDFDHDKFLEYYKEND